jgi:transcriptional regulator CtsR
MILNASQRGGAKQLANHLLKTVENEHVEVHEIRGFISDNLVGALHETDAISKGTRCQQFLFSLSLNPPRGEIVSVEVFEAAIEQTEQKLGLNDQPRAIVFHEKEGRRHAHVVWSRINADTMTAVNLPYFKMKLRDISKELFLEHNWKMPRGLVDSKDRNPLNFTFAEWQQAQRTKQDPKVLKAMFQECWAISDSRKAFAKALEDRGFYLAQGNRHGFVAVDYQGELYAIARYTNKRSKEVKAKLGDPKTLPTVIETKALIASRMTDMIKNYISEATTALSKANATLAFKKSQMVQKHQAARKQLFNAIDTRWATEIAYRAQRLSRGFKGLWDRVTGKHAQIKRQHEYEAWKGFLRDQALKETLISTQLNERGVLQQEIDGAQKVHAKEMTNLHRDIAHYMRLGDKTSTPEKQRAIEKAPTPPLSGPFFEPEI